LFFVRPLTLWARTHELNRVVVDLKSLRLSLWEGKLVKAYYLHVSHPSAPLANHMVVSVRPAIKTNGFPSALNMPDYAQINQCVKHSVHGCPGNAWDTLIYDFKNLVSSGMVFPLQDSLKYGPPLNRQRKPSAAAQRLKPTQLLTVFMPLHIATFW